MWETIAALVAEYWATAAAAAAAGAGTYSNYQADKAVRNEQTARMNTEAQRQYQLGEEARRKVAETTQKMTPQEQEARRQELEQQTTQATQPQQGLVKEAEYTDSNPGAPVEVKTDIARRLSEAMSKGTDYAKRQAKLSSFGRGNLQNNLLLGQAGSDLSVPLGFSSSSSALMPGELMQAQSAGDGWRTAGDVFGGVSDIASMYGAVNQGKKKPAYRGGTGAEGASIYGPNY